MEKMNTIAVRDINTLFDSGTFVEIGSYVRRNCSSNELEGVVCGYGSIGGKLVFAFAQDGEKMKGAFDDKHAKKIENLYKMAISNGAPVVGMFNSSGAFVCDGVSALAAYGRFMNCVSEASGIIPQIAFVSGVCAGSSAVAASMFDFVITAKDSSKLYVNPPFVTGKEAADSEFLSDNGISAITVENNDQAIAKIRDLVEILPQNNAEGVSFEISTDDINRVVDIDGKDFDELIAAIADDGKFFEIYSSYANETAVGFASFGGILTAVAGSRHNVNSGFLTYKGARKISKLLSFADSFGIPFLTLVNSDGIEKTKDAEAAPFASELAKLALAYTSASNAKVSVVVGNAVGAAYTLMGSKSIGSDIAFALDSSYIGMLSAEASVAFLWDDKVSADKTREQVESEWKAEYANPYKAADYGEIDDIIDARELRQRICAAFSMLVAKASDKPLRKHVNMPL